VLGIGGWRALEAQGLDVDVCHLNEGHAAFVILERAHCFARKSGLSFWEALWATRGGNVFTTHTPVPAGFDTFDASLLQRLLPYVDSFQGNSGVTLDEFVALGRQDQENAEEGLNMVYLALRGCSRSNGVSRLHGAVSRRLFLPLFPRWPEEEVPISVVTNGVHMPSWDSPISDELWTRSCGKDRWRFPDHAQFGKIANATDEDLWMLRGQQRAGLVHYLRVRVEQQLRHRGIPVQDSNGASRLFAPNTLTLGIARRFTEYKRPTLLLRDPERLHRILLDPTRPVQIVVAGKAHPQDEAGKLMVREWVEFANQPDVRLHVAFIEDYDIAVAEALTQGVDVWLNTPRRGWEACGTSGMKVLVNGGLNLSSLDGWWAEAYSPDVGWTLGESERLNETQESNHDEAAAIRLYDTLENDVIPCFYDRDEHGLPRRWLHMVRTSMETLAPAFSSGRMVQDYVEQLYHPACDTYRQRIVDNGALARELRIWEMSLRKNWHQLHFGIMEAAREDGDWQVSVPVYLGEVEPNAIAVQLYADADPGKTPEIEILTRGEAIPGSANGFVYSARVASLRPIEDYTARIVPFHPKAVLPAELPLIHWHRR
jgi:starch phosphorylase